MALALLIILSVFLLGRAFPESWRWRDFSWLHTWLSRGFGGSGKDSSASALEALLLPGLLLASCGVVQWMLQTSFYGLPHFLFSLVVFFLCWGPRELEADIEAILRAPDSTRRETAAQTLRYDATTSISMDASHLVEASFLTSLSRWFGVLFWFIVLGPAGALAYRVIQLMARSPEYDALFNAAQKTLLERAALAVDWLPAQLMALTVALVTDFDAVFSTWRNHRTTHGKGFFVLDLGFLSAIARAGVDADVMAGDGYATDVSDPMEELSDARKVLRRVLILWLSLIALLALAGMS